MTTMATIKKKELKKYKKEAEEIEELVNVDGSPIEGDEVHNNDSEIEVPRGQTSDEFATQTRARNNYYDMYGSSISSRGGRSGVTVEGEELDESEGLDEVAREKMRKMVEDHLTQQGKSNGMVNRTDNSDVNRNGIPDIEDLDKTNPLISRELKNFTNRMSRITLKPEEKGVILNYLLQNMNTQDIPSDYKQIIINTIR